ncbi:Eco57I restriction-modification methylase domain-containing protein [Laribacter hongkongensis]|uniref:Eco57I restriction-modification methylase domain-containing protein n=1 Tax=Laribacter hongkongensis TaxID=168471 RepID=UPI001877A675|nr:N-6 DNA methylase [Laribacter hongkongensis]
MSTQHNELHHDWLSLVEISGPFLAAPVLKEVFPQGLEELDSGKRKRLRQTYEEWCDAIECGDVLIDALHTAWIDEVLARTLELDEDGKGDVLKRMEWCAAHLATTLIEHGVGIAPDYAVVDEQKDDAPLMFVHRYAPDVDLNDAQKFDGWTATPAERMVALCRAKGCRIGLVTNGERWMLVDAPVGAVTSFASWHARLWIQEPITLQAFVHLLRCGRFFGNDDAKLPALIDRSLKFQDEVTDALGDQVRRAVEVLIQALDKADQDRDRELLRGISEPALYEAALTVMMRLVFLLSAEERGLLLMGDGKYEAHYAISTLRSQLMIEEPEILEKRKDAWSRLLATFRAVFGGIDHENLRLPALGGSLFDPDRFPFLEGRSAGTTWRTDPAKPLPIDNRTVLLLLEAIQQLQGRTLSYRALDVEQIGYVYEGLLERTVKRTADVTLDIGATLKAEKPLVTLAELESAKLDGKDRLVALLRERSGSSESRVRNDLAKPIDDALSERLLTACLGDTELLGRIKPYGHLLRVDPWGYPLVYPKGAFVVTAGTDRRETGTHYTPKSLTEAIVTETLTPIAYVGPANGLPRAEWRLKPPAELLDLKICDPAMGSGAFLVQACRWLAERLAEAWSRVEDTGHVVSADGEVLPNGGAKELLPRDAESRIIIARRLIAERCLYGVDLNPLAVELAKLSIWLVTLAKDRPFGFLDHNLRCGDSLLGTHRLDQLTQLSMAPNAQGQLRLFGQNIEQTVREAIDLRLHLREMPIRDIRDVEAMAHLDADARRRLEVPERIADAFIGEVLASGGSASTVEGAITMLAIQADQALADDHNALAAIVKRARETLKVDSHLGRYVRNPFHWALEYPEVFERSKAGFDIVISNPPWGASLLPELQALWKNTDGNKLDRMIDSFHLFLIRACQLLNSGFDSSAGLLVPDVLLYQGYSQRLREALLSEHRITHVCNIGDGVFTRVTRPCCYIIFSTQHRSNSEIAVGGWRTSSSGNDLDFKLPQKILRAFPGSIIPTGNIGEYSEIARLVAAIPCKLATLVDDMGIQRGVSADNKDVFVMPGVQAQSEHLEAAFLKKVVTGGVHLKPFEIYGNLPLLIYTTRDTRPELIPNIIDWVGRNASKITCKEVQQGKHPIYALHRPRDQGIFERGEKILGVITADRPKVAVDTERLFALDGIFVLSPAKDVNAYYLAGLLNSNVMARIYRVFSQEEGRVMAQVKPTVLAELPAVHPNSGDQIIQELVCQISMLAKILHDKTLDQVTRVNMMIELDEYVEKLFARAIALSGENHSSSICEVRS